MAEANGSAKVVPKASPFAQRLIKRGGELICAKCHAPARSLPHRCQPYGAR